jgi:competence protein ComEA
MDERALEPILGLILLDLAAVEAYEIAVSACALREAKSTLQSFREDHARHATELSEWARSQGVEPPTELDPSGVTIRDYTDLACEEDRTAILAMMGNEELTNEAYASAMRARVPPEALAIIERGFADERRHAAWLRAFVKQNGWDAEPEEIRELATELERRAA